MSDPIKHIVVLMMENRSFDHCFFALNGGQPNSNVDAENNSIPQQAIASDKLKQDPKHEHPNVMLQIGRGRNNGFAFDYSLHYLQHSGVWNQAMAYFPANHLYALHALAGEFMVCDRWFSSLPGPTWPNRFFIHSGTSKGDVQMRTANPTSYFRYDQTTIYDLLNARNISWNIYYGDVPQSLLLTGQRSSSNRSRYKKMQAFYSDVVNAQLPQYSFIEPRYSHHPLGEPQNDDHPPSNVLHGQRLIANIFNALRNKPEVWDSTLFVLLYDEHGGFYDSVPPPSAVSPDGLSEIFSYDFPDQTPGTTPPNSHPGQSKINGDDNSYNFKFDSLGIRVPALLISPWVQQGVDHTVFDHTSVLRYLIDKWGLNGNALGNRVSKANSIGGVITNARRDSTIASISIPLAATPGAPAEPSLNRNQVGLITLSRYLGMNLVGGQPPPLPMGAFDATPAEEWEEACERVDAFIAGQGPQPQPQQGEGQ